MQVTSDENTDNETDEKYVSEPVEHATKKSVSEPAK